MSKAASYGMFTEKGNAAVHELVQEIKKFAESQCDHCKRFPSDQELREDLSGRMAIVKKNHGEIYDTEVRNQLYYILKDVWESLGYDPHTLENEL